MRNRLILLLLPVFDLCVSYTQQMCCIPHTRGLCSLPPRPGLPCIHTKSWRPAYVFRFLVLGDLVGTNTCRMCAGTLPLGACVRRIFSSNVSTHSAHRGNSLSGRLCYCYAKALVAGRRCEHFCLSLERRNSIDDSMMNSQNRIDDSCLSPCAAVRVCVRERVRLFF